MGASPAMRIPAEPARPSDRALDPDAPPRRGADDPLWPQRRRWRRLVDEALPIEAARRATVPARRWPVSDNHCFARIILDAVCGRPWREVLPAPAWRNMDARTLARALALGEDIRAGRADLWALDAASLRLRGRRPKARPPKAYD